MSKYFIASRLWPGFFLNSDFPFNRFTSLPDDRIGDAIEKYVQEWITKNPERIKAALDHQQSGCVARPNPASDTDVKLYYGRLRNLNGDELLEEAESLQVANNRDSFLTHREAELLQERIKSAGSKGPLLPIVQVAAVAGVNARCMNFITIGGQTVIDYPLFSEAEKNTQHVAKWESQPTVFQYCRIAKWARFPSLQFDNSPASRQFFVWYGESIKIASSLCAAVDLRFRGEGTCLKSAVLRADRFQSKQQVHLERIIDDLRSPDDVPDHTRNAQKIAQEIIKIEKKMEDGVTRTNEGKRLIQNTPQSEHWKTATKAAEIANGFTKLNKCWSTFWRGFCIKHEVLNRDGKKKSGAPTKYRREVEMGSFCNAIIENIIEIDEKIPQDIKRRNEMRDAMRLKYGLEWEPEK